MASDGKKIIMPLDGVHCASCVRRIEAALSALDGVASVSVHLPTRTAFVEFNPAAVSVEAIRAAVEKLGYRVLGVSDSGKSEETLVLAGLEQELKRYSVRFAGSAALAAGVFLAGAAGLSQYTVLVFATAIWAWAGAHFHAGFLKSLKSLSPDMNTLVSLSVTTAYLYSVAAVFLADYLPRSMHGPLWHDIALLVMFINLGRLLEAYSRKNAGSSVLKLLKMAPRFARVLADGRETIVPVGQVRAGDILLARPGEQIAVDGEVIEGLSAVDESALTGESIPADKMPGNKVFGGTINKSGALTYKAVKVGSDMAFARIIASVRQSQMTKAPVQQLADRVSFYFVPAVMLVAFAGAGLWLAFGGDDKFFRAINSFVSVLAVSCPCALGLAVPMALVIGFDRASGAGILIRNAEALESIGKIDTVVLDKTGTVTQGKLSVSGAVSADNDERALLRSALLAEQRSEHPFAEAIRKYAEGKDIQALRPDTVEAVPGRGIKVSFGSELIRVGSIHWLSSQGVELKNLRIPEHTDSVLGVASNNKFIGYFTVTDNLRPRAKEAVDKLRALGLDVIMLSGDREPVVERVAGDVGITTFYSEVFPEDKSRIVGDLQLAGKRVAVVGDGFNDAPALAKADVGMAFSSGTDVAVETAGVTLMRRDLAAVRDAIVLSREIRKIVKQNLYWAFGYNVLLIPLAAGAFYPFFRLSLPPSFAGAAMALSSVSVVLNSLKLRKVKL